MIKARAAIAVGSNQPLILDEVIVSAPKSSEVLVQTKAAGICHTDVFTLSGRDPEGLFPCILGHEGAGIVVETGSLVTSVQPGDHVIMLYTPECRACAYCLSGKTNLCQAIRQTQGKGLMPDGSSRFMWKNKMVHHYMGTSTFSEFTVLPEIAVVKIPAQAAFAAAAFIGCGVTTGVGAAVFSARVTPGSTVVVFGLGSIGLNVVQGARLCGAEQIIGIDKNPQRQVLARQFGMTHFMQPGANDDVVAGIIKLTDGGADFSFECIGNVQVMRQALECCHKGWGKSIIIGVAGAGEEISTRPFQLVTGRVWMGSAFGGARGRTDVPKIVRWYLQKKIAVDPMITQRLRLDDINEGLAQMHSGSGVHSVIEY